MDEVKKQNDALLEEIITFQKDANSDPGKVSLKGDNALEKRLLAGPEALIKNITTSIELLQSYGEDLCAGKKTMSKLLTQKYALICRICKKRSNARLNRLATEMEALRPQMNG